MKVLDLLRKLYFYWSDFRFGVKSFFSTNCYQFRDVMMVGAGFFGEKDVPLWKYCCMLMYRLLGYYQLVMAVAKTGLSICEGDNFLDILGSLLVSLFMLAVEFKVFMFKHYRQSIRQIQSFFDGRYGHSGDYRFDIRMYRRANSVTWKAFLAMYLLICCDQVLIWIPNSAQERMFGIPTRFADYGSRISKTMQGMYLCSLAYFWGCRYFCCSSIVMPLLVKLRADLAIVQHGFEMIRINTDSRWESNALLWGYLKKLFNRTVKQHFRILRHVNLMQPAVNNTYATVYYSNMGLVALAVFLAIQSGMTFMSFCLIITAIGFMVECYSWCFLIGLIQDTMMEISSTASQLAFLPPHSPKHHSEYVQWRTSLMIVQLNASQMDWFRCGNIFFISTERFGELCMIVYRFAAFLMKFA
ncbi:AAEL017495-PA [Aedes aegypti]|uniref:Odorant receptor n=2 Tax=Aedes aegypti TaxID=7159 RepID=J9HSE1_AEDAE|nr:uncharacterized protein LOC23687915 [Aedes aegypti]EJY57528.1 AAEL017495-PA [Aedes aegypti]DAA80426.1 TPA_exp: odorant receptor 95 [Aedes aegypti]